MPRRVLSVFFPLLAAGCVYNLTPEKMSYPSGWPQVRPADSTSCEDFVGVYSANGENAQYSPNGANSPKLLTLLGLLGHRLRSG